MADPGATTDKHKAWTNYDVFVALSDKLDASERAVNGRLDDMDRRAVERNGDLLTKIGQIEVTLQQHDARIGAVERRDAPRSHGIAIGAIAVASWLGVLILAVSIAMVVTHAPLPR